jgi:hypothetical protein|tara:strand:- start:77 stop:196 length:120 start_codon:yes stop_codon:yes gene_type:complete
MGDRKIKTYSNKDEIYVGRITEKHPSKFLSSDNFSGGMK